MAILSIGLVVAPAEAAVIAFSDPFESGDMSNWASVSAVTVQPNIVHNGSWAARATSTGQPSFAWRGLATSPTDLHLSLGFHVVSRSSAVWLASFRTTTGGPLALVGVNGAGKLIVRNAVSATTLTSPIAVGSGSWHSIDLHVVSGTSGGVATTYDDSPVPSLTASMDLGGSSFGRVMIGDNATGRTFDVAIDDVEVANEGAFGDSEPPLTPTGLTARATGDAGIQLAWSPSSDNVGVAGYTIYRARVGSVLQPVASTSALAYQDAPLTPQTTYVYAVDAHDSAGNASPRSATVQATTLSTSTQSFFFIMCTGSHTSYDDPIVFPGLQGATHQHEFVGNRSTNYASTYASMIAAGTTCKLSTDTAGYWMPSIVVPGASGPFSPKTSFAYYRVPNGAVDPAAVEPFPPDMKLVAGGDTVAAPTVAYWHCTDAGARSPRPIDCGTRNIRATVVFPACWDGVDFWTASWTRGGQDAHMRYPVKAGCPATHAIPLPKLVLTFIFPRRNGAGVTLSSGDASTLHADFWNTWGQAGLESAVRDCINAGLVCGERTDPPA